jgi:hypothetical protein
MRTENATSVGQEVNIKVVTFLMLALASAAFAEDFKTVTGKEYKDATITRVEPDGIVLKTKSGITKVHFAELPKEVQERFHYDPQKATAYTAEQSAGYAAYQKQQEEAAQRQREELAAKNKEIFAQQQAIKNRMALQDRYTALQQEENATLVKIGEAKQPGPAYWGGSKGTTLRHHPNPQKSQLPFLESHLKDVRHEKDQVRKQLEKPQR